MGRRESEKRQESDELGWSPPPAPRALISKSHVFRKAVNSVFKGKFFS